MSVIVRNELAAHVVELRLNRPARLNTLTVSVVRELLTSLKAVREDPSIRAVVLTGAGPAFCAGADLDEADGDNTVGATETWDQQQQFSECVLALRSLPQPVNAAVQGAATGGGLALALGCDIRIASTAARFGAAFVRVGLSGCDMGTSWNLARLIGTGRAHELMLTGRIIDSEEALHIGLVTQVVTADELLATAVSQAQLIVRNSPLGVEMTKKVMWSTVSIDHLRDAVELENRTQVLLTQTSDFNEAVQAFHEKRSPNFTRS
ncbi:enoyl-CoA hydratase/isomerase family protein [Mycolicibacterium fluoranthenivorans]|uniref:Enoyl-CoA hydratase/isomerase family protein n=1 Tax=Mycolicibacterium fluoranthenivorans TaxID=258505 RepID=A0A7G8PGD6_9MYCO|nr:enoyl-CoA hydratase-related protein [Mycolicibacterium fluoranthenivorans]QNJ93402.1 enoyl-CoA hydratase/isomerase family protein [Mycolicibacterium fluoranthenivorans]